MKRILLIITALFFATSFVFSQNSIASDKILGIWLSEKKDGKVEIYKSGNKYYGKLIWGKTMFEADGITSKSDLKNENERLRIRKLKDLVILTDFIFNDDVWSEGKIYDPDSGKTYSCIMSLKNNVLSIRGYIGISFFGRTSEWTRLK